MLRNLLFLSSIILLISACGGGSSSSDQSVNNLKTYCESVGLPTRSAGERVINGEECGGLTTASIVRIAALLVDGRAVPICTGTMISSDDVLTAAHCFGETSISEIPIVGWGIITGEPGLATYIPANALAINPGYAAGVDRLFGDAAVMQLSFAPFLPVIPVLLSTSAVPGQQGLVYGYGARFEGDAGALDPELFVNLNAGAMNIENITPNHIFVIYDGTGTNVCNGDSGGPMILPVGGVPTIIGLVSQGTTIGCTAGDITTMTNLQDPGVLNWLVTVVPDLAVF